MAGPAHAGSCPGLGGGIMEQIATVLADSSPRGPGKHLTHALPHGTVLLSLPPPRGKLGDEEVVSHIVVRPRGGRPVGRDGAVTVWSFEKALYFSLEIIGGTTLTAPPGPFVGVFSCLCAPLDLKGSIRDD